MASKRRTKQAKNQPIVARPAVTTASGIVVADWQRLPRQLLQEHVQKLKIYAARPDYLRARCLEDGKHRCRVVLKHLKQNDRSLTFAPNESFDTFELAKEWAAMLALQNLCNGLAFERKLPEPFRSGWLSLSTPTPVITTNARFHSDYDRQLAVRESAQNRNRSTNIKEARKHFQRGQMSKLAMDDEHHQMLEHVLSRNSKAAGGDSDPNRVMIPSNMSSAIRSEFVSLGFHNDDIDGALAQAPFFQSDLDPKSVRNTVLQWILVHAPERRLPATYRQKQSSAVVAHGGHVSAFTNLSLLDQLRRLGYPSIACHLAVSQHPESYQDARLWLYRNMVDFLSSSESAPPSASTTASATELQAELSAERLALSAIYEDAFVVIDERSWEVDLDDLQLRLRIETGWSDYPAAVPLIEIQSEHLSVMDRISIQQRLITEVAVPASAEITPITHECVGFLQQNPPHLVLQSYRARWPAHWLLPAPSVQQADRSRTAPAPKPKRRPVPSQSSNEAFQDRWRQRCESVQYAQVLKARSRLPVWRHRHRLIDAVHTHQVVVICAETGSGKSTQIPAFLLDDDVERGRGPACRVICTQPRRISAISLAEHVAQQYCEKVGDTVGYRIRMESKTSHNTRIEYVTNGLLLRQLLSDTELTEVSHVVLDEVHERSVEIDLLLLILRQLLQRRSDLRLILMSATLQSDLLSSYFNGCPVVQVPGRTFPVNVSYVEDLIEATGYYPSERYRIKSKSSSNRSGADLPHDGDALSEKTWSAVSCLNPDICNIDLVIAAIWHIITTYPSETGAILCFLPGVGEITSSLRQFKRSIDERQCQQSDFMLVPLHGGLSSSEQGRVFQRPPPSTRKIIFATNVAETSITVNDVVFVVDSGRVRQTQFDAGRNVSMLVETLVSRSNAEQRRGRAGRVRSGICIRLFSRLQYDHMPNEHRSELSRVSLDHVCLQIRGLLKSTEPLAELFAAMIESPAPDAVLRAIRSLQIIGAFEPNSESLTGLGRHLCVLPMDIRLGKMLIFGACLSCVTPVIRIAALLSVGSPFLGGAEHRDDVYRIRLRYAGNSNSDHLALHRLYEAWLDARVQSAEAAAQFCLDNFVSNTTLKSVLDLSFQYRDALSQLGFITTRKTGGGKAALDINSEHDQNSDQLNLITAVLAAGLYPNIIRVRYPEQRFNQTLSGAIPRSHDARSVRYYRADGQRVFLHPCSVNFQASSYSYPYLAYLEQRQTSKLYVFDATVMALYPLLMFGGRLKILYDQNQILVDDWIKLEASGRLGALVNGLREQLDQLLDKKVHDPAFDVSSGDVIRAIVHLFVSNGGFT